MTGPSIGNTIAPGSAISAPRPTFDVAAVDAAIENFKNAKGDGEYLQGPDDWGLIDGEQSPDEVRAGILPANKERIMQDMLTKLGPDPSVDEIAAFVKENFRIHERGWQFGVDAIGPMVQLTKELVAAYAGAAAPEDDFIPWPGSEIPGSDLPTYPQSPQLPQYPQYPQYQFPQLPEGITYEDVLRAIEFLRQADSYGYPFVPSSHPYPYPDSGSYVPEMPPVPAEYGG